MTPTIPAVTPLRQTAPQPVVADVAAEVRHQWQGSRLGRQVRAGDRVAVACGSRGIANVAVIVRSTLDYLAGLGARPFVVAAMGSHGGATAEGQRQLLAEYGISEAALGVPVRTEMDTVQLGTNAWGEPVYWDRNAFGADAVVTVSRVKPHTDFRGRFESGVLKMLVIGLGKRDGAAQHHRWGVRGLREMMPETAKVILARTKFAAGLAVLENAREETARLQVVDRDELFEVEPILLDEARRLMGRLPFDRLDLLVIGEIGKNYSGAGIDPNVVGRLLIEGEQEPESPTIIRICCLDLSPESHGNGTGVGIADLTTQRLLDAIDPAPFRMNNLTKSLTILRCSHNVTVDLLPLGENRHEDHLCRLQLHPLLDARAGPGRQPEASDRRCRRMVPEERRQPRRVDHALRPRQVRVHRGPPQEPRPPCLGGLPEARRERPGAQGLVPHHREPRPTDPRGRAGGSPAVDGPPRRRGQHRPVEAGDPFPP
jgi:hypothetical protein